MSPLKKYTVAMQVENHSVFTDAFFLAAENTNFKLQDEGMILHEGVFFITTAT